MSNPCLIRAEGLCKTFRVPEKKEGLAASLSGLFRRTCRYVVAVDQVSFKIEPGKTVGFIGPNGASKTTTLKMLSGVLYPSSYDGAVRGGIGLFQTESAQIRRRVRLIYRVWRASRPFTIGQNKDGIVKCVEFIVKEVA